MTTLHKTRILFFGTPHFAVPSLLRLLDAGAQVLVVTMPDRPAGRSKQLQASPVKRAAEERHIQVLQPQKLDAEFLERVRTWNPDLAVVAAFGKIFKPNLLAIPAAGFVNVHPSLLPRHRGASPIAGAILGGDTKTGVSIMKLDEGLDTGPILAQRSHPLRGNETTGELSATLAELGAELLLTTLPQYLDGSLQPSPQAADGVTMTKILKKDDGRIDATRPAAEIERSVRAFTPWPGAWLLHNGRRLKVLAARVVADPQSEAQGSIIAVPNDRALGLVCGDGQILRFASVQWEGKREADAAAFFNGNQKLIGTQVDGTTGVV